MWGSNKLFSACLLQETTEEYAICTRTRQVLDVSSVPHKTAYPGVIKAVGPWHFSPAQLQAFDTLPQESVLMSKITPLADLVLS